MKRLLSFIFLASIFCSTEVLAYTISINQFVEHPSLDATVTGFKDQLAVDGFEVTYNEHNAQANMPTVLQIVSQIIGEKPDLILAIATPSAQASAQKITDIPILFTAVTDPVTAGLVKSAAKPEGNVTGTTDMNPVAAQIALIREIQPQAKTLGIIYNAGEINSVVQVDIAKVAAAKEGFQLEEAVTTNTAGVYQAAQSLVGKVDAIYLPTDNTVIASYDSIVKIGQEHKIPLYPAEDDSVRKGGIAVLSISYYDLGRQTGVMAEKILKGEATPATLPVEAQPTNNLIINSKFAAEIGLELPKEILSRAQEIIK